MDLLLPRLQGFMLLLSNILFDFIFIVYFNILLFYLFLYFLTVLYVVIEVLVSALHLHLVFLKLDFVDADPFLGHFYFFLQIMIFNV